MTINSLITFIFYTRSEYDTTHLSLQFLLFVYVSKRKHYSYFGKC